MQNNPRSKLFRGCKWLESRVEVVPPPPHLQQNNDPIHTVRASARWKQVHVLEFATQYRSKSNGEFIVKLKSCLTKPLAIVSYFTKNEQKKKILFLTGLSWFKHSQTYLLWPLQKMVVHYTAFCFFLEKMPDPFLTVFLQNILRV